ncbi:hypothetical protein C0991_006562 [Blastosporella zonata]|nr:hypothetical protein C0991_006562 [Blastosporella zonata]
MADQELSPIDSLLGEWVFPNPGTKSNPSGTSTIDPVTGGIHIPETPPENLQPGDLWQIIQAVGTTVHDNAQQRAVKNGAILSALQELKQQAHQNSQIPSIPTMCPPSPPPVPLLQLPPVFILVSNGVGAPKVCKLHMFDSSVSQVNGFLHEITAALHLQRRSLVTDYDKVLYFSFYLKDGSPIAWYSSIQNYHPELLNNYNTFVNAFIQHFDDSNKHAMALAKVKKLRQDGTASNYASRY